MLYKHPGKGKDQEKICKSLLKQKFCQQFKINTQNNLMNLQNAERRTKGKNKNEHLSTIDGQGKELNKKGEIRK